MKLLGDWSWYLPGFLRWLPRITIEGEPEDAFEVGASGAPDASATRSPATM